MLAKIATRLVHVNSMSLTKSAKRTLEIATNASDNNFICKKTPIILFEKKCNVKHKTKMRIDRLNALAKQLHCVSKNVPLCDCPYLCHILTDFQHSFTGTLFGQYAIKWLLNISSHHNCIATLPCET